MAAPKNLFGELTAVWGFGMAPSEAFEPKKWKVMSDSATAGCWGDAFPVTELDKASAAWDSASTTDPAVLP